MPAFDQLNLTTARLRLRPLAEIGYALARAAWGTRLMAEALDALVAHAFGVLQLNRIEADIDPRNTSPAKSLTRLGFVN